MYTCFQEWGFPVGTAAKTPVYNWCEVRCFVNVSLLVFMKSIQHKCIWVCVCNHNRLCVTGAGLSCPAGPQVSNQGSVGKAIHLRTAQGIVGHCSEEKGRALQRVPAE